LSLWTTLDCYTYDVTGIQVLENATPTADKVEDPSFGKSRDSVEASLDDMVREHLLCNAG
jgi:hypothetical protein